MRLLINCFLVVLLAVACAKQPVNIEAALVDQVLSDFAVERFTHYLRGGAPKSNREILEKVLSRHSLRFAQFAPALRRFQPDIFDRLFGKPPTK